MLPFLVLNYLLIFTHYVRGQDLSILGYFDYYSVAITTREQGYIYGKCFYGLGFRSCTPLVPSDQSLYHQNLPYYNLLGTKEGGTLGTLYCVECCGTHPNNIDIWNLTCAVDYSSIITSNVYGYELRLATNSYPGDRGYVTCPLKRNGCKYNGKETIACEKSMDTLGTYLIGYTVTIEVAQYDAYFKYWRGSLSCSIETMERNTSLTLTEKFREDFILIHYPNSKINVIGYDKIAIVLVFLFAMLYAILYFCRRKHCLYCTKKLVFSKELCYMCKFYGVQPPDPVLIKALEEKGQKLQGEMPERFPFAKVTTFVCRKLWGCLSNLINCCCFCGCCRADGCCCCCRLCSKRKSADNAPIYPEENNAVEEFKLDEEKSSLSETEKKFVSTNESPKPVVVTEPSSKVKIKKKKKKINPNILYYPPHIIYGAVGNENIPDKIIPAPVREEMTIDVVPFNNDDE